MAQSELSADTVVVGGGIGGLAAAALLARAGRRVVLLEKSSTLGGRGASQVESGFHFNLGPHALYRGGHAMRILRSLGLNPTGGVPSADGGLAVKAGRGHTLPGGFISLLTTGLLGVGGKIEFARALATLPRLDASAHDSTSWSDWVGSNHRDPVARELLTALIRLSTYTNAPDTLSAGAALRQLQMALADNVLYLDGGWQTLVDGLREAAATAGAEIRRSARVAAVRAAQPGYRLELADGSALEAEAVVMAVPAAASAAMCDGAAGATLAGWNEEMVPVRAACLDVGLAQLPRSRNLFALGVDVPLYLSVHSAIARLAEPGAHLVQVAKYVPAGEDSDAAADERELEGLLDLAQPGWREHVVERRFLPNMVVSHAVVEARTAARRPGPEVPGCDGLYVAGDWVGPDGMLVDASLASAENATARILERGSGRSRDAA